MGLYSSSHRPRTKTFSKGKNKTKQNKKQQKTKEQQQQQQLLYTCYLELSVPCVFCLHKYGLKIGHSELSFISVSKCGFVRNQSYENVFPLQVHFLMQILSCNISNARDSISSEDPNTEKRVENSSRIGVFLTKFEVFG